jgi:putative ATP-dependent endonuclease of OLD family
MHLERLEVDGFRSCRHTTAWFQPDLTVLVGENNGGKSNLVDAIRLVTQPADGRRSRYCEPDDLSAGRTTPSFDIRTTYRGLTNAQQGMFIAASDGLAGGISRRLRYELPAEGERRGKTTWTVGLNDAIDPEPAARDRIRHVYLPPLRDAELALGSGAGDRIEFVLRALATPTDVPDLEAAAAAAFDSLQAHSLVERADGAIADQVTALTAGALPQESALGFTDPVLRQLARSMRLKLGSAGFNPVELRHSGLGYANLLFLATVVTELAATTDADLTLFLVEEPEAHLHPQLQSLVLAYLTGASQAIDGGGSVQVVVTTHSAQLASAVPSRHVQAVRLSQVPLPAPAAGAPIEDPTQPDAEPADAPIPTETRTVPVWSLDISDRHRRKVDRYLNATRAALLFGPNALLVEGIAEMILLPALAGRVLDSPDALARFRGASLVGIDGVDFEPYVRMLLTRHDGLCIAHTVVVITDRDPAAPGDRVASLNQLAHQLGSAEELVVKAADITLEASLQQAGNEACLRQAFLDQLPNSGAIWDTQVAGVAEAGRPAAVINLLKEKRILKGDFAQSVAAWIEDPDKAFAVPPYLSAAIQAAASA